MMPTTHESFAFVDAGRTYSCCVETGSRPNAEPWWWFRVSTEDHQRYAPFRAEADDTTDLVRNRVVAYYENLLARRAEPARGRWTRQRPAVATPTPPIA